LFQERKSGQKMIAVVLYNPREKGKRYRLATEKDLEIFKEAEKYLEVKRKELMEQRGFGPVPDEELPPRQTLGFRVQRYGILKWGDLFNSRQKLALITFVEKVRQAHKKMLEEGYEKEYAKAVVSYLALAISRLLDRNCLLARWVVQSESIAEIFSRQALPMLWDYVENFSLTYFNNIIRWITKVLSNISLICTDSLSPKVLQLSATSLSFPDNYFEAVFTDPPYYDNVPYSYLSDFFYVWLKRVIGDLYPDLFSTPSTPKSKEIVAYINNGTREKAKSVFVSMLKKSFQEIYRVLRPEGIATIVYAYKTTSGWETVINSLLDSGLTVTASWPINTEMKTRLRAKESAALASSIYIVCRKFEKKDIGWINQVKEELKEHLNKKLERLWNEGISGPDFFISGIGSAIEVFGKYKKIMDYQGNQLRGDKLLSLVRKEVTDFAVKQILKNGFEEEISPLTRFYILWRWTYRENKVIFDDAKKLAQSVGIDLEKVWNKTFILKEKEFLKVAGPDERNIEELYSSKELIDVLHLSLLLWQKNDDLGMKKVLSSTGFGLKDTFYKVAQAISETLPITSREKKLLDGFLSGKSRITKEIKEIDEKKEKEQQKLF